MMTKRVFIGYKCDALPDLVSTVEKLKKSLGGASVKWTSPAYWHITSHFLGQVSSRQLETLKEMITEVASANSTFKVSVTKIGFFSSPYRPRVIWAGTEPVDELEKLYEDAAKLLLKNGFDIDKRPYNPHITLARIKHCNDTSVTKQIAEDYKDHIFGSVDVDHIILYESRLYPAGAKYIPVFKGELT